MKILVLMRHAKAANATSTGDFARALTKRGEDDARESGKQMARLGKHADIILSSDAVRALATARIIADELDCARPIVEGHDIYDASADELLSMLHTIPESANVAILVGHNPGFQGLIYALSSDIRLVPHLTPGSFAVLQFDIESWSAIEPEIGRVVESYSP